MIKTLLKVYELSSLQEMVREYFKDERCQQHGMDIKNFFYETNRRTSLKAMNPLEQAKKDLGWK